MRILAKIVESLVLSMFHILQDLLVRRFVAFELISHDYPWHEALFFQKLAKESLCCLGVTMPLQQDIQYVRATNRLPATNSIAVF